MLTSMRPGYAIAIHGQDAEKETLALLTLSEY